MAHSYYIWLIHTRFDSCIIYRSRSSEKWLIRAGHDSFTPDMTHSYETWLVHIRCSSSYRTGLKHPTLGKGWERRWIARNSRTATHCKELQHTAIHCNTLQHTATLQLTYLANGERGDEQHETAVVAEPNASLYGLWIYACNHTYVYVYIYINVCIYTYVMPHVWISHGTHMNESCHTNEESYHTYEQIMSNIWMSHFTHMNESCHTYGWVMSHVWMGHVT